MKLLSLLFALLICSCTEKTESEESSKSSTVHNADIMNVYQDYKESILNDKGSAAYECIDKETRDYYDWLIVASNELNKKQIQALGLMDHFTICVLRKNLTASELAKMSGKDLFIYAIDNGMVGKNSVVNAELGNVITNGNFSKAEFVVNGQKTPFFFHFYREDKLWKLDITHLFSLGTMALKKMVEDSGETENDFITNILEVLTGKKPTKNIWKPII